MGDGSETAAGRGGGALASVNLDSVHLDELPAYDAVTQSRGRISDPQPPPHVDDGPPPPPSPGQASPVQSFSPPNEPPPGYETVQNQSVAYELERRLRGSVSP